MKLSRRRFITVGTASAASIGLLSSLLITRNIWESSIIDIVIDENFSEVDLSVEIRSKFKQDFLNYIKDYHSNDGYLLKLGALSAIPAVYYNSKARELMPKDIQDQIAQFEESIITKLLLSTNFFYRQPDEQLRYTLFYNPYKYGCINPLAVSEL